MSAPQMTTAEALRSALASTIACSAKELQEAVGQLVVATSAECPDAHSDVRSLSDPQSRTTVLLADRISAGQEALALAEEIERHHGRQVAQVVLGDRAAELLGGDGKVSNYIEQPATRLNPAQQVALTALLSALSQATDCGLFDEMAAHSHPDRINAFCDDLDGFAVAEGVKAGQEPSRREVKKNIDDANESIQEVADDVLERAKRYGFKPDEDMVREAVEESANLLNIELTETQITEACQRVMNPRAVLNSIEQPINATIQTGVLTLPSGQSIDLTKVQAALNFGFQETGDHDLMAACDEMSKLTGLVQGPSGEFVPAGNQQNAAIPRAAPDLAGVDAYALQCELERRGLLVQLWSPGDFEFIGNEDEDAADLSDDTLEQIQQQAFEQCRRSLDEITTQRGNEHLGDWWAMNKQPILTQFKAKDEAPSPGM